MTPPTYSPLAVTTSKVVAVPKSTTTHWAAIPGEGGDVVDQAVGAELSWIVDQDRHARADAGLDEDRLDLEVMLADAAQGAFYWGHH